MKRSSRHPSSSAAGPSGSDQAARPRARRRPFKNQVAAALRWLHIYLSMFGLGTVLFFGLTGITLNHPDWVFGQAEVTVQAEGRVDARWLDPTPAPSGSKADADPDGPVRRLEVVEHLRKEHGIRGALAEFKVDDRECMVTFKGPGYSADAFIDRESGSYRMTETRLGFLAVINDLHKGRDTGPVWSAVIDLSAALMVVLSLTGLALLFYIKRRRVPGSLIGLAGAAALAALYWFWVP